MWILSASWPHSRMNACSSAELSCRTNERISLGRRAAEFHPDPMQRPDVPDHVVILEVNARPLEHLLAGRVHADVDGVEPGLDHPARDVLGDERPVADHPDFLDALRLGVAHLLDELAVEERLAVVVHAHVRDAERRALVDDLLEEVHVHDPLLPVHLVARAEHALGVAEVRALDLDDVRQPAGLVAAGREQQFSDGLGVGAQQPLGGGSRATGQRHAFDYR